VTRITGQRALIALFLWTARIAPHPCAGVEIDAATRRSSRAGSGLS